MTRKIVFHYIQNGPHGEEVSITFRGMNKNVKASDTKLFDDILKAAETDDEDSLVELLDKATRIKKASGGKFEIIDGFIHIDGEPAPNAISNKIISFMDKGLSYVPLIEFWRKLKKNPSYNSRLQLFGFLEANRVPIVDDVIGSVDFSGYFVAWKSVTQDFKDHHTKKINNSPGSLVEMDRRNVDDNPNNTCSSGLHVASWDYAWGFEDNAKYVQVYVDPEHVVSVPTDYNNQKMRCCKYYVVKEIEKDDVQKYLQKDVIGSNSDDDFDDDDFYEEDEEDFED